MKVTHIIDSGGYYGAEVMLVNLCRAQQKAGLQVEVISIGTRGDYKKPLEKKLEEYGIPFTQWRMLALPDIRESFEILKHCQQQGTDIIHSHGYKGNILLGLIPKRWRKIPVVTTVHGYTHQRGFSKMMFNQLLDRFFLSRLDAVVLVSEGMKHQVPTSKIEKKMYVVANGIPPLTTAESDRKTPIQNPDRIRIISVGRLSAEKNFSFLLHKIHKLKEENYDISLVIYGDGPERKNLENLITKMDIEKEVKLPGYCQNINNAYKDADIYINCSLTEGMPLTLLEAMREGIYVLASNIPANREVLKKIKEGELIFNLNDNSLEKALIKYREDSGETGKLLKHVFLEKYTSEIMSNKYLEIYLAEKKKNDKHD